MDWTLPAGHLKDWCKAFDQPPESVYQDRAREFLSKGPGAGSDASKRLIARQWAEYAIFRSWRGGGFKGPDAKRLTDLALSILDRRTFPEPGQENDLPLGIVAWILPGSTEMRCSAFATKGEHLPPDLARALAHAQSVGKLIVRQDTDKLIDAIQRVITERHPDCPAVLGKPKLRTVAAA